MTACPYPIADLLPHAAPMVLLDRVTGWTDDSLTAVVTITQDTRFATSNKGVPAHIGIEWMAQACGAFAGMQAKTTGQPVQLGFLLGTRDFTADRPWFTTGETLSVSVRRVFLESGMAVFDCQIVANEATCARARLTVFQPDRNDQ
jgi:predicted hotdog family 3-hydroxylacyl-ACP dehydratase